MNKLIDKYGSLRFFVVIFLLLIILFFVTKRLILTKIDCQFCRNVVVLIAKPIDYNDAIGITNVGNEIERIVLAPKYVGPFAVEFYPKREESNIEVKSVQCNDQIIFRPTVGGYSKNLVFSKFGHGAIFGVIKILPEHLTSKYPVYCDVSFYGNYLGQLVVSRMSEL
jgi:hypothetical protein